MMRGSCLGRIGTVAIGPEDYEICEHARTMLGNITDGDIIDSIFAQVPMLSRDSPATVKVHVDSVSRVLQPLIFR